MSKAKDKLKNLWSEFKKFISRGNVIDMAVGVVIGTAFSAIVTSVVNILISVCTWGVPGGISGLVTVLPALNEAQKAPEGYETVYTVTEFLEKGFTSTEAGMYTKYGSNYYYNGVALINWGALINAIIAFIIIALTLFVILKVYTALKHKRDQINQKLLEEYYEKHPEARPVPPAPGEPKLTEVDLLVDIKNELKKLNSTNNTNE